MASVLRKRRLLIGWFWASPAATLLLLMAAVLVNNDYFHDNPLVGTLTLLGEIYSIIYVGIIFLAALLGACKRRVRWTVPLIVLLHIALLALLYRVCVILLFIFFVGTEFYGVTPSSVWPLYVIFYFLPASIWFPTSGRKLLNIMGRALGLEAPDAVVTGENHEP